MTSPAPGIIEVTVEPKSNAHAEKLLTALASLTAQDSAFTVSIDQESGQIMLKGMSEEHLDMKIDALRRLHEIDVHIGAPQVAYRETITREGTVDYTHKKQSGGSGQFARVKIHLIPGAPGSGFMFESKIVDGSVPEKYVPGVEKGLESVLGSGVLAGFPVVDLKVELIDGAYHDVDSSALAFESASRAGLREGLRKCNSVLLEPIMKVEVVTPEDYIGAIVADLRSRGGQIERSERRGLTMAVQALVSLANMFGYLNQLRAMSRGRATFAMQFEHYQQVPSPDDDPPFALAIAMRP